MTTSPSAQVAKLVTGSARPRKGRGTLEGLRPGTWEIECETMEGGEESSRKQTVEVKAGQTVTVEFGR